MRLLELESSIKSRIRESKDDPEIYNLLQKMTFMFLARKKACKNEKDREDISFIIAGDLYMRILDGEEFSYYLGYLEKIYREYLCKFYEGYNNHLPLDPSIDANHELLGSPTLFDYYRLNNQIYLKEIYRVIDELMDETCKYKPQTKEYLNLKISLILSLIRGETSFFHLGEEQKFYLKFLVVKFYDKVRNEGLDIDSNLCIGGN